MKDRAALIGTDENPCGCCGDNACGCYRFSDLQMCGGLGATVTCEFGSDFTGTFERYVNEWYEAPTFGYITRGETTLTQRSVIRFGHDFTNGTCTPTVTCIEHTYHFLFRQIVNGNSQDTIRIDETDCTGANVPNIGTFAYGGSIGGVLYSGNPTVPYLPLNNFPTPPDYDPLRSCAGVRNWRENGLPQNPIVAQHAIQMSTSCLAGSFALVVPFYQWNQFRGQGLNTTTINIEVNAPCGSSGVRGGTGPNGMPGGEWRPPWSECTSCGG